MWVGIGWMTAWYLLFLLVGAGAVRREKAAEGVCESEDACDSAMAVDKEEAVFQVGTPVSPGGPATIQGVNPKLSFFVDVGNKEIKVVGPDGASITSVKSEVNGPNLNTPGTVVSGFASLVGEWLNVANVPREDAHIFVFGTAGVRKCRFADAVEFQACVNSRGITKVFPGTTWHFSILEDQEEALYQISSVEKLQPDIRVDAMVAPGSASTQCGLFLNKGRWNGQPVENHIMAQVADHLLACRDREPRVLLIGSAAYVAIAAKIIPSNIEPQDQALSTYEKVLELLEKLAAACRDGNFTLFPAKARDSCGQKLDNLLSLFHAGRASWDRTGPTGIPLTQIPSLLFARQWGKNKMITLADGVAHSASQNPFGVPSLGEWSTVGTAEKWGFIHVDRQIREKCTHYIEPGGNFTSGFFDPEPQHLNYSAAATNEEHDEFVLNDGEIGIAELPSVRPTMSSSDRQPSMLARS